MLRRRPLSNLLALLAIAAGACRSTSAPNLVPTPGGERQVSIPAEAVKQVPAEDAYPPILHSSEFAEPVPLPGPVNTAGLEDSPFIAPDGRLYFYFTPSASVPAERQLVDGVSGIYVSAPDSSGWSEPQRVVLQEPGKVALDGCADVLMDRMWFCSAREGYAGIHWYTAILVDGEWSGWQLADGLLPQDGQVGELHFTADGRRVFFHSDRDAGMGGRDLWSAERSSGGTWSPSLNLAEVNTGEDEGWPYVTPDGRQLWFTRQYLGAPAIFRSQASADGWTEPELIVDHFAGEPTLDAEGNLYFVHHFFRDGTMIEADIYLAKRAR
jgi:WD40-like Beta Propeller Repeat